ncbi:phosphatidate cytidylyltransferase 4, chloroplastic-like isoform X2 [Macadamia integrifolia]|uniref:phosphatidate cytidylyltransferase 4, chloroplastic-like isoform X2 n=1 Tax=Macadamia integrifolia TaxID=60698 RepID=UPI001C4F7DB3|nr:phosphatidate cytidylyltransferase 4, chloroplastic-like isoform X2 [Macadamia integrifolia]
MFISKHKTGRDSMTASYVEIDRLKLSPLSLPSICPCQHDLSSKTQAFSQSDSKLKLILSSDGSRGLVGVPRDRRLSVYGNFRTLAAVARAKPNQIDEGEAKGLSLEVDESPNSEEKEVDVGMARDNNLASERHQGVSQLKERIVFGIGIGVCVAGVVLAGGWVFTVALAAAVFVGAREYFELVRSRGFAKGMTPPPRYVSRVCSVICALMPVLTLYFGQIDVSVTSAAFVVAMALLLQRGNPRFAQLSSAMFGLFYCGYLPCFWVKLRCGLAIPPLNSELGTSWPIFLGGREHWTVGLVATLISFSCIIVADTYAFLGGKTFGRTPLTNISPKKTWEGAIAGLGGCIATALILSKILSWPTSLLSAAAFGFLNFVGSLFGDLIESMIKRDAGVKDSGSLIPGHGSYDEEDAW